MTKVIIDEKEYESDEMSEDAKAQLQSLQFVTNELSRLQLQSAALQTARNAYSQALKQALGEDPGDQTELGDGNVSFD